MSGIALRKFRKGDERRVFELLQEKDIFLYVENIPWPYAKKDAEKFVLEAMDKFGGERYRFAITTDDEVIGTIELSNAKRGRATIGYWLGKPYWGKGIMTRSVKALIERFKGKIDLIESRVNANNVASQRVLEKCGFRKIGRMPNGHRGTLGNISDCFIYYKKI